MKQLKQTLLVFTIAVGLFAKAQTGNDFQQVQLQIMRMKQVLAVLNQCSSKEE
jgi:hypothetical protein